MKAYKATYNQKCITIKYEVGKTYTFNGQIEMCEQGFHFCENPKDTLNYYSFADNYVLMEIEVLGEVIKEGNKSVTNKFKVIRIIPKEETNELLGIIREYDSRNNLIYYKSNNGAEEWYEYDSNNNLTHYKNSSGLEEWNEYDSNNKLIHHKNSDGNEDWYEYDSNNNLTHYKNSSGNEEWNEYDSNNNMIHHKTGHGIDWSILIE